MIYVRWAAIVLVLAAFPWIGMILFGGLRRMTLAQIGLMTVVLGFGLAAPRLSLHLFYVVGLVLIGSALVATMKR